MKGTSEAANHKSVQTIHWYAERYHVISMAPLFSRQTHFPTMERCPIPSFRVNWGIEAGHGHRDWHQREDLIFPHDHIFANDPSGKKSSKSLRSFSNLLNSHNHIDYNCCWSLFSPYLKTTVVSDVGFTLDMVPLPTGRFFACSLQR